MEKKVPLILAAVLSITLVTPTFAESNTSYKATQVPETTIEKEEAYLKNADLYKVYNLPQYTPMYDYVENGTTRVAPYTLPGSGLLLNDQKSGVFSQIKDTVLLAGNFFPGLGWTVASIVDSVVDYLNDYLDGTDTYITAKTGYMYRYIGKEGQVWDSSEGRWIVKFDTRSRETYLAKIATWTDTQNRPHGGMVVSYSPDKIEYSAHYNDETYIRQQAFWNWYYNMYYSIETW